MKHRVTRRGAAAIALLGAFGALVVAYRSRTEDAGNPGGSGIRVGQADVGKADEGSCDGGVESVIHQPLHNWCDRHPDAESCPRTLEEFPVKRLCEAGETVIREQGCGKVAFAVTAYRGSPVFNEKTKQLIGVYSYSDIDVGPCIVQRYVFGEGLLPVGANGASGRQVCADIRYCAVCGTHTGHPPCRPLR